MALPLQPLSKQTDTSLVVLLHAFRHTPSRLDHVARIVREEKRAAHIIVPPLPLSWRSREDLTDVAVNVVTLIDQQVQHRADQQWDEFDEIIMVGHSTGSMISRKAYVIICGEISEAPFVHRRQSNPSRLSPRMPWAHRVRRIVQLSGMNGGWSVSHHMGLRRSLEFTVGSAFAHLVLSITHRRLAIDHIRRGAPFLTGLRLQWLAMLKQARDKKLDTAMVVQLLGTVDDLVSPDDNIDMVTGSDFIYMDVARTGHVEMIEMDSSDAGQARRNKFVLALTGTKEALLKASVVPSDPDRIARSSGGFTDVVFVVHGIRDTGFWTHKIARQVQAAGRKLRPPRNYATVTSTYGYFPMLSFLLPWRRREKVAWLMERYVSARSLYPDAHFDYVGHSNGTYLLADALKDNPACRFHNVVFAGSVVRRNYDWALAADRSQMSSVLNYVATNDKVVACFPGALERLGFQDLGSAGHAGFEQAHPQNRQVSEVCFVEGGHGAALSEQHWVDIANFICTGKAPEQVKVGKQNPSAVFFGKHPWIAWVLILSVFAALTLGISTIPQEGLRVLMLIVLWWMVSKILTQF